MLSLFGDLPPVQASHVPLLSICSTEHSQAELSLFGDLPPVQASHVPLLSICSVEHSQAVLSLFGCFPPVQLIGVTQAPSAFSVCPLGHSQVLLLSSSVCPVGQTQASLAAFGILSPAQLSEFVAQLPAAFSICPVGHSQAELLLFGIIPLGHASHDVCPEFGIMFPVHAVHEFPPMLTSLPVHAVHELLPPDSCPSGQIHAELSPFGIIPLGHASHAVFPEFGTISPVHD